MTRTLIVPMLVDGMALPEGRTVVGPPDFRRLPYTAKDEGGQRDVNVGSPFLAESTHNEPFSDDSLQLGAGIHLHWTLPRPLRTAVHPVDPKTGAVDQGKAVFRKAPDRWLVCRWTGSELQKCWLIEGDFVWSWDDPAAHALGEALSVWPWRMVRDPNGSIRFETTVGEPPWRYVGRSRPLGEPWPNQKLGTSLKSVGEMLSAEGYGDPTFAAYYPSCRSIFGHHNPDPTINDALSYEVFGWYSTAADDLVAELAGRFASDPAGFRHRLKRDFQWSWDQAESPPERMLCYGRLHAKNSTGEARDAVELQLAIAGSGTEALASLLAAKMAARRYPNDPPRQIPEQQRLEQHLDALLMSTQLKGHQVDIGDQLAIARHQRSFQAVHGSVLHVLRPRGTEGKVDPGLVLPASLAADVDRLNAVQANFDSRRADVAALRRRVYSEWYRAVKATDPPLGTNRFWVLSERDPTAGHDADSVYALLRNRTLPALERALSETAELANSLQALRAKIDAAVKDHNAQPKAQPWSLDTIPGPRFFAPADPTVALLGSAIKASDRWSEDSLLRDSDGCVQCNVQADVLETLSALGEPGADTRLTASLKAGPLRSAFDAVWKTSLLDREPGHVHLFSMEWEVQYAPVLKSPQAADAFRTDFLQKNWKLGEFDHAQEEHPELKFGDTEMICGSSLLLQHASPVMKDSLKGYILGRLSEPVVSVDDSTNQPLHPLTAAVKPPAKVAVKTWLEAYAPGEELTESLLARRYNDIHAWVETAFTARRTLQAAEALVQYQQVQRPEALKKSARVYGLPDMGKVAEAICGVINGHHGDAGFFENTLQLPRELAEKLANLPTGDSLQAVDAALGWGAVPFARLLQRAETESRLGITGVEQAVRGHALVHGMPQGGRIAKVFCKLVNNLQDTELLDNVGLRPEVVQSILEARFTPISSLARLASLPHVTPATFSRLLVYAEQSAAFAGLNEEAVIPPVGSWEDVHGQEVVDPLRTALEAWKALSEMPNVLTHTLGGFHDSLLQWENAPQLPVADPVGFSDYRQFAEEAVRPAVGNVLRKAPLPHARFHPIRAGEVRLQRLRLIDTFGQKRDVSIGDVRTTTEMTTRSGFHASLPPRITQPVRLDFRWQAADRHGLEWTPHPTTSPICGWLIADNADESLVFYHADGRMLGSLDHRGRWRLAPSATAPVRPQDIENPNLRKLVVYLARKAAAEDPNASPSFVARFVALVDDALESIHPPQSPTEESLSLLMSRPVALVRSSIQVELRDPPATRQDLEALIAELQGRPPLTDGFEEVELPIRIGEHERLNDGVVAWWMEDSLGNLEENARAPQRGAQQISLSPAQGMRTCSVLLDPHGSIHATCGMLPTRILTLPTDVYAPALGRMELRMLAAPILTQRGQFQLPIPKEPGWTWSYLYLDERGWGEIGAEPQIEKAVLEKCFPKQPDLWYRLVHCGALATQPDDPTRARVCYPAPPADPKAPPPQLEDSLKEFPDAVEIARVLMTQSHRLEAPIPGPAFQPLELREGWLRLRRANP